MIEVAAVVIQMMILMTLMMTMILMTLIMLVIDNKYKGQTLLVTYFFIRISAHKKRVESKLYPALNSALAVFESV